MSLTRDDVLNALAAIPYPGFRRDIVSLGCVQDLSIDADALRLLLALDSTAAAETAETLGRSVRGALEALADRPASLQVRVRRGAGDPSLRLAAPRRSVAAAGAVDTGLIPGVHDVIAVASGKGGVGKSTVAVNLAVALARRGAKVGLLDADIYGPSIPLMTGIVERPLLTPDKRLVPFERFGLRIMSLGFLVDPESAVIWRGPMVMKALEQLLRDVEWGDLDLLVVDMPPGTGDAQLTLSQKVQLAGAVIVTTPQDVALADARKGVAMFRKVGVSVLGIVENMSYFQCPRCSERAEIFGHGGGRAEAARLGVEFLGEVPLDTRLREGSDAGAPVVWADPSSPLARIFAEIAERVARTLHPTANAEPKETGSIFERFRKVWHPPDP